MTTGTMTEIVKGIQRVFAPKYLVTGITPEKGEIRTTLPALNEVDAIIGARRRLGYFAVKNVVML